MKFQVFKDGKVVDKFTLSGAYLFGADGIGIRRTKITFKNALLECARPSLETAGLALLWSIDGFGRVLLPTTCLPQRVKPYILNLEIARAKLMQIINKREDWLFFNQLEGLEEISVDASRLFIHAVQNVQEPSVASKLADKSLQKAIVFSEKLTENHAESLFRARSKGHGFGQGCLGCKIDPAQINNAGYIEKLLGLFGSVTVPINWAKIERQKGVYDFSALDVCIQALAKKRLKFSAGPLLCFSKEYLPEWLLNSKVSFENIRDTSYQFASRVTARYSGIIHTWCVISGLNAFNHFGFNFEQALEMTRAANMAVKAASDRALKIIGVSNPWGEYYATTPYSIPPLVYMDMVVQSGINFDAFGLSLQFGKNQEGMHVRDIMQISAILDYFAPIAKPLYITDVAVPSQSADGLYEPESAGVWHEQWNQSLQAQWIEKFYKIALSKPFVDTVTYSNLSDTTDSLVAHSGLLTNRFEPKESFRALKKLRDAIFTR